MSRIRIEVNRYPGIWLATSGNSAVTLGPVSVTPMRIVINKALYWFQRERKFDGAEYAKLCAGGELPNVEVNRRGV